MTHYASDTMHFRGFNRKQSDRLNAKALLVIDATK